MADTNHIQNVAIVGAGGQIGKFIVDALFQKGTFKITALSRHGSTNTPAPGVHVISIDYDQHQTLVDALKGQDVLVITMAVFAPPDQQEKLIRAASDAGVPWILPNEYGGDGMNEAVQRDILMGVRKKQIRDLIESLGTSKWIGMATSFWYEYSLGGPGLYGIDIEKREVVWFDDGLQKLNTSTWAQTGRAVAGLLSLPISRGNQDIPTTLSDYANKYVYISSFAVSQHDMFDSLKRVTGTTDADWKFTSVKAKERFEENVKKMESGDPDFMAFPYRLYTRYFFPGENAGLYEVTKGLDNERLGLPKEDLDEFTKKSVELAESGYYKELFGI